jgi:tubby-related protein 1
VFDRGNDNDNDGTENRHRESENRDSAQALRQKMATQHQAFMKKRSSLGSSGMVMSTNCEPAHSPLQHAQSEVGSALSPAGISRSTTAASVYSADDGAVVAPFHEESEVDLEQRRRSRVDDLKERGLAMVFDPSPTINPLYSTELRNMDRETTKQFLMNPLPKGVMLECRILREKSGLSKFYPKFIFETDTGVFLAASKKRSKNKTSNYLITMDTNDLNKKNENYLGKVRSNFLGSEFTAFGPGTNPKDVEASGGADVDGIREEFVSVAYSSSLFGKKPRGPRKMSITMPAVTNSGERMPCKALNPQVDGLLALAERYAQQSATSASTPPTVTRYVNKPPKWNDQIGAFVLNFNKRVTQASVKNFQLIRSDDPDMVYLQFGRVLKDTFSIDFRYPISPFQAFSIALSSFDYKLCCE